MVEIVALTSFTIWNNNAQLYKKLVCTCSTYLYLNISYSATERCSSTAFFYDHYRSIHFQSETEMQTKVIVIPYYLLPVQMYVSSADRFYNQSKKYEFWYRFFLWPLKIHSFWGWDTDKGNRYPILSFSSPDVFVFCL